jgi:hypothetical protein
MITARAAIPIRALIPDPAAIRTGRAMSMPRLESRVPPATGLPRASGTVMPGASAACASAADQVAAVSVPRADSHGGRPWATTCQHARLLAVRFVEVSSSIIMNCLNRSRSGNLSSAFCMTARYPT